MEIYVVKPGDTAESIAGAFGIPSYVLRMLNNLDEIPGLVVGQALLVLRPVRYHTVRGNETLFSIAEMYNIDLNTLYRNNPNLKGSPVIYPNQTIIVEMERNPVDSIAVNGYAYPYIDKTLLRTTLPYINYMTPFTYGITESGSLVQLDDNELISIAADYGVIPLMHLSTLTEAGNFSNELASLVLNDPVIQERLIDEILLNMSEKGYRGLDIDFEFVYPQDSLLYGEFIGKLRDRLNPLGYQVIAALAPKTSDNQRGLLYEGHNYKAIGDKIGRAHV